MQDSNKISARLLGGRAASHLPVLVGILDDLGPHEYHFMSSEAYGHLLRSDWREAMRVYWLEILYRAHFAAATSLARTARWVDAILTHGEEPNYTAFMASYRGCLEASADSFHTFQSVPGLLAELHVIIRLAVTGRSKQPCFCKEIEDDLIHFTHARHVKKGEAAEDAHRAKQVKEYLASLADSGIPEITQCYRTLSDVTHPGIGSVHCYAERFGTSSGAVYRLDLAQDAVLIKAFSDEFAKVSERMIYSGVVPPVMVLRILNEFPVKEVHTPGAMKVGVERQPMWQFFKDRLQDSRYPDGNRPGSTWEVHKLER